MHSRDVVAEALRLRREEGLGARRAAKRLKVPLGTVRDWYAGKLPRHARADAPGGGHPPPRCPRCGHEKHRSAELPPAYVYLLGLYLGDGTVSRHHRGVFKLRVFLDRMYPGIVDECAAAMSATIAASAVNRWLTVSNCFEVYSFSRAWHVSSRKAAPARSTRAGSGWPTGSSDWPSATPSSCCAG